MRRAPSSVESSQSRLCAHDAAQKKYGHLVAALTVSNLKQTSCKAKMVKRCEGKV